MKKLIYLLPFLLFACSQTDDNIEPEPEAFVCPDGFQIPADAYGTIDNLYQGDILISQTKQAGAITKLWPDRVIPVYFDSRYEGTDQKELVYKAMEEFEALGFTFTELTEDEYFRYPDAEYPNKVQIKWSGIAASSVGLDNSMQGWQDLYLPVEWNTFYSTAVHEIGHLVGLWHPHNTPMQDEWLDINWDNIQPEKRDFFEAYADENFEYGDEYDIWSVMNYSSYDFAIDASIYTMRTKDGREFQTTDGLSDGDQLSINRMYECFENR